MSDGLDLIAQPPDATLAASRSGYFHKLVDGSPYEKIFGVKIRAVKRWRAIGLRKSPPDPPPLDEPKKLLAWWSRNMRQRPPLRLEELARSAEVASPSSEEPVEPREPEALPPVVVEVGQGGFLETLERLRGAEAQAGARYVGYIKAASESREAGHEVTAARYDSEAEASRRIWEKLTKELRSYEKDAKAILEARGEVWVKSDVIDSVSGLFGVVAEGVRGLIRRVRPKLRGLSEEEQNAVWARETEGLFASLLESDFTKTEPSAE